MSDQSEGPGWWLASDGKWYPPQSAPQSATQPPPNYGYPPVAPPKEGMNGCLKAFLIVSGIGVILVIAFAIVAVVAVDDVSKDLDTQEADKLNDAKIVECGIDEAGFMAAKVEITNDSSDRSNYDVTVAYTSPDGSEQFATGDAFARALEAGQKITEEAQSLTEPPPGEFRCEITDVTRFSDEP